MATALYLLFGILDQQIIPAVADRILIVRLAVAALLFGIFLLTFRPSFGKIFPGMMILVVLLTGAGIIWMIIIANGASANRYYAGLMLVVMFGQAMLRLRFIHATISTWLVILSYHVMSVTVVRAPGDVLLNNSFFLVGANILGMFTSYGIELFMKTVFCQRRTLLEKQATLNREHGRQTRELQAAREIQLAMLPSTVPTRPWMDICFSMTTATEVGGDYYDWTESPDGALTFVVADAAGHGAQAGVLVAAMKIMFSNHAAADGVAAFLRRASRHLRVMRIPKMFLAAAVVRVWQGEVEVVGAGLPPALLLRASTGRVERVNLNGIPLGTFVDADYQAKNLPLHEGDVLVCMTDGYPEARNTLGEMFGEDRCAEAIAQEAGGQAADVVRGLHAAVQRWINGTRSEDDMTVLVIKRK